MNIQIVAIVLFSAIAGGTHAFEICGELRGAHYGPYDYRTERARLNIVEIAHFTLKVETLRGGESGSIVNDITYTLHASPNHHRALVALMNLASKMKTDRPPEAKYSVECYFDRAIRFSPDDGAVRVIFANYLIRRGDKANAVKQLEIARDLGLQSPNLQYNMGLAYLEVGDFEKALEYAHLAYAGGFNLPGLKSRLVAAGKWREAPEVSGESSARSASGGGEAGVEVPGK